MKVKVASVNFIYGSHFSATETTYEVSQNMGNFVDSLYLQELDVNELCRIEINVKHIYIVVYTFPLFKK